MLVAAALLLPYVLSSPAPSVDTQLNSLQSSLDEAVHAEADAEQYDNYIHVSEKMTPKEYEAAVVKLQQSSAESSSGSEYNSGTIGSVRQDCEACISAQQGSITAHSVRATPKSQVMPPYTFLTRQTTLASLCRRVRRTHKPLSKLSQPPRVIWRPPKAT